MLQIGALRLASGRLVLGPLADRRFGRKNFMELFAVFSSPQTYNVQTAAGKPLGSLAQAFVDRLVDGVSTFLLGGRSWAVIRVQHDDRRVLSSLRMEDVSLLGEASFRSSWGWRFASKFAAY